MKDSLIEATRKDIVEYIEKEFKTTRTWNSQTDIDTWVCTPLFLFTKESRKLNRRLGLHKINKQSNADNFGR